MQMNKICTFQVEQKGRQISTDGWFYFFKTEANEPTE